MMSWPWHQGDALQLANMEVVRRARFGVIFSRCLPDGERHRDITLRENDTYKNNEGEIYKTSDEEVAS